MKVVLFFLAVAAMIAGMFWYARHQGYVGEISREENCPPTTPSDVNADDEYVSYSYGDRVKQVAEGCI